MSEKSNEIIKKVLKREKDTYVVRSVDYIDLLVTPNNIIEENDDHTIVFLQGSALLVPLKHIKGPTKFVLELGTVVNMVPSEILPDSIYNGDGSYKVLRFHEGDLFIENTTVVKHVKNVDFLFKKGLLGGNIKGLPYSEAISVFENNLKLNSELNLTSFLKEGLISILFRDKDNPEQPVRLRKDGDVNKYVTLDARAIAQVSSTHGAMTFEDANTSTIISTTRGKDNTSNVPSLEKYFDL